MKCPMCESEDTKKVSHDGQALYCPKCNHTWRVENGADEKEGELVFNGMPEANSFFEALCKGFELSPQMRAVMEAQLTALLFNQWFEGMKAGKMLSIIYARDHYDGKTRNEQRKPNTKFGIGDPEARRAGDNRKDLFSQRSDDPANPRAKTGTGEVEELINGVKLHYETRLRVPERIYALVAEMPEGIEDVTYDGTSLRLKL